MHGTNHVTIPLFTVSSPVQYERIKFPICAQEATLW
uniref:Uncharacterized protein n=1 Tax=Arundo donax TaxID=35708 RepID=A0A0A9DKF9_ARUDO